MSIIKMFLQGKIQYKNADLERNSKNFPVEFTQKCGLRSCLTF